jgi:hypothetical protein
MFRVHFFIFILILLAAAFRARADGVACRPEAGPSQIIASLSSVGCEAFRQACEVKYGRDPDLAAHLKSCESQDPERRLEEHVLGCLKLFPQPLIDSVRGLLTSAAQSARENIRATNQLIELCVKDPQLREWMLSKTLLQGFRGKAVVRDQCAAIVVDFQDWSQRQKTDELSAKLLRRPLQTLKRSPAPEDGPAPEGIFNRTWQEQKEKFNCLNNYGKTALACYYFFSVLDPSLAGGIVLKAPGLIKAFGLAGAPVGKAGESLRIVQGPSVHSTSSAASVGTAPTATPAVMSESAQNVLRVSSQTIFNVKDTPDLLKLYREVPRDRGPPASSERGIGKLESGVGGSVRVLEKGDEKFTDVRIYHPTSGLKMGEVDASYVRSKKELEVGTMTTADEYQQMGVGEALMEGLLRKFPETQIISTGALVKTNEYLLETAMRKGLSLEAAIKETPAYKIRARFGYTEIVPGSITRDYGFKVRKPGFNH